MEQIINHPNYQGLPIQQKADGSYAWIATAKSKIGQQRIEWCIDKAQELGFIINQEIYPGMYVDVMLEIPPICVFASPFSNLSSSLGSIILAR